MVPGVVVPGVVAPGVVVPGLAVIVSYSLTASRLLTADQSLRRQLQSAGGTADDDPRRQRRRWQNSTVDSRHPSPASQVGL